MCIIRKKPHNVRQIYKTIDGFSNGRTDITKPRRVVVVAQRRMDNAVVLAKIYSAKDKSGVAFVEGLTLLPEEHSSLKEPSYVGRKPFWGMKPKNGQYKPFYVRDFEPTSDMLTRREYRIVKRQLGGPTKKNQKTAKRTTRRWRHGFKKK